MEERENTYKGQMKRLWEEVTAFRLNGVELVPVSMLELKLPRIFGHNVLEREELTSFTHTEKERLEQLCQELNIKMSVKTLTSDNLGSFLGFRVDLIDQLHTMLSKKKNVENLNCL